MLIGIDFDNTIVCYDQIFHSLARERGLIPANVPVNKGAVRDHLRAAGRESLWTELQGYVYGPGLGRADAFEGVWDFVRACEDRGIDVRIVSHKTLHPYAGPSYDLHAASRRWLDAEIGRNRLNFDSGRHLHLELTKADKLARIGALRCDWFIDDLPEFLQEDAFPTTTRQILFDPSGEAALPPRAVRAKSWAAINAGFFSAQPWALMHD